MNKYIKLFLIALATSLSVTIVYFLIFKLIFKDFDTTYVGPAILVAALLAFIKAISKTNLKER